MRDNGSSCAGSGGVGYGAEGGGVHNTMYVLGCC